MEGERYQQYEIREGVIFLIEVSGEVLSGDTPVLSEILRSINDLMSEAIITSKSTGVGIYLYNCESPFKTTKVPGMQRVFRLNPINLTNMKQLNDLVTDDEQGVKPITSIIKPHAGDGNELPKVLNCVLDEFMAKSYFNRRKLVWITANDRPYSKPSTKENLWRIINDYYNYGYFILPMFISDSTFDMSKYTDIFLNTNYMKPGQQPVSGHRGFSKNSSVFKPTLFSQIRKSILRIREVRRIQFSCDLFLSDAVANGILGCTVKGYTFCSPEKFKRDLLLYTKDETLKKVFTESTLYKEGTEETIESKSDANVVKGYPLAGGEILFLNDEQVNFINNYAFDHEPDPFNPPQDEELNEYELNKDKKSEFPAFSPPPYLKLLGFRDLARFNPVYNSGPPIFVTPDLSDGLKGKSQQGFKNSFTTFASLYQSCVKLQKYAVVFGCPRHTSKPSLYALYPTRVANSSRNSDLGAEFPQGFLLIRMPWLDDVRSLPNYYLTEEANLYDSASSSLPAHLVNTYKELLSQFFTTSYDPQDYSNPSLNYFYKTIKHDLLQITLSESEKDVMKNDVTTRKLAELRSFLDQDTSRTHLVQQLDRILSELEQTLPKRRIPDEVAAKMKRSKIEVPELDEDAVLTAWKNNEWTMFTVAQLKKFQQKHKDKIKSATKKQDIIDNISKFLDERSNQLPN